MTRESDFDARMRLVFKLALTTSRGYGLERKPKDPAILYAQAERKWQGLLKREARDRGMDFKWFMKEYGDWLQIHPMQTCARCLEIGDHHCLAHSESTPSQLCGHCQEELMDKYQFEHGMSFKCEDCGKTTAERNGYDGGRACEPCFRARPRNARFHGQRVRAARKS